MEGGKPLISIIVPVYNMKNYIHRCVNSLINQTYKNIEIILVNDGSKDGSLDIIEQYAKRDNRIKVINQKNSGQGCARNSGLDIAKGEYIGFVDCDDFIMPDMYERLYKDCIDNDADIAICDIYTTENIKPDNSKAKTKVLEFNDFYPRLINDEITSHPANKLFKKQLFSDGSKKVRFKKRNSVDDMFIMPTIFKNAKKVAIDNAKLYMYFIDRTDSVSNNKKNIGINAYQRFTAFRERVQICDTYGYNSDISLKKTVSFGIGAYGALNHKSNENECNEIRNYFCMNRDKIYSVKIINSYRKIAVRMICDNPQAYILLKSMWGRLSEN